jgi:Domain of unknown function (DUF4268)
LLLQLKKILRQITGEEWHWRPLTKDQPAKTIGEIYIALNHVNVLNKRNWPAVISFLKSHMIALDIFWREYKYAFEPSCLLPANWQGRRADVLSSLMLPR